MTKPILFDCDTGIDDSLALLYLLGHPRAELAGIVSTAGNVPVDVVCANNLAWLDLLDRDDVPVHVGAAQPLACPLMTTEDTHGPLGVGYADLPPATIRASAVDGVDAWLDAAAAHDGELVGLVTGPLTTLAAAIRRDPRLPARLKRLVVMGGAFWHPGNTTPLAEWNIAVDPEAAHEVFTAFEREPDAAPLYVCGLNITEAIAFTPAHLGRLAGLVGSRPVEEPDPADERGLRSVADNAVVRHLTDAVRFYFEFHLDHDEGYLAHMHDPFAAAVALDPRIATTVAACVDVETGGALTRGATVADVRGMWGRRQNARIVTATDVDAFFDDLLTRLATTARAT